MKPPVTNPRQTVGGRSNGARQANDSVPPTYIPMRHLELAGIRRSVLVALVIAFLIPVAVAVWALSRVGGSNPVAGSSRALAAGHTAAHRAVRHAAVTVNSRQSPLFKALQGVNESSYAHGYLPPSSCKAMGASMVTCMQPHYAIDEVSFSTFPSMTALYAAYESRVSTLAQGPFRANFGNCTETDINGEIGWNHDFRHPGYYPMSMFTSGRVTDEEAAGRMYCTLNNGVLYLVWTQDAGRLLGELAGAPHLDAYLWWHNVHHEIAFPGAPNLMQSMSGMQSKTSTQTASQRMSSTHATQSMPSTHAKQSSKSMTGMRK